MTVQSVNRLFAYNQWAWRRVFPSLAALPAAEYFAERPFFWNSLHGLAVHGFSAERNWLLRIAGESPSSLTSASEFASFAEVQAAWEPLWRDWQNLIDTLSPAALERYLHYRNTEGIGYQVVLDDVLRHVFNHATEHRSQMTPLLAQLGHPTEPLDFARFAMIPT